MKECACGFVDGHVGTRTDWLNRRLCLPISTDPSCTAQMSPASQYLVLARKTSNWKSSPPYDGCSPWLEMTVTVHHPDSPAKTILWRLCRDRSE
jgi:hypothetical protein